MRAVVFRGKINILDSNYIFDYDGQNLVVHLYDQEMAQKLLLTKLQNGCYAESINKKLPFEILSGVILPNNTKVVFKIDNRNYYYDSPLFINPGNLYIPIYRYMIVEKSNYKNTGTRMCYRSSYMQKLFGLNIFSRKDANNNIVMTNNFEHIKDILGKYSKNKIKYEIKPDYSCKTGSVFEIKPQLLIKVNRKINPNKIFDIYEKICNIIQILFIRNNIYPNEFIAESKGIKYSICERDWDIYKEKDENMNFSSNIESPLWEDINNNLDKLIDNILGDSNKTYLAFIYNKKSARYEFSTATISSDSAMFENVFNKVYPEFQKHKCKNTEKYGRVHKYLKRQIKRNTGKIKSIYEDLDKYLDHARLEDKIRYALNDYSQRILYIRRKANNYENIRKISKTCADYRNQVDHGFISFEFDEEIAEAFFVYRALILAMIYNSWGMDDKTISKTLSNVLSCK